MNRVQFLLGKLAEEASEVAKRALKTQQFGMLEIMPGQPLNNAQRCHEELNDLLGIVEMLNNEFDFGFRRDEDAIAMKRRKVNRYAKLSRELGMVTAQQKESES
jgi:NTP pyrophosphatase (non-canonical NTP hydrolase)